MNQARIEVLTAPQSVHMATEWYEMTSPDHFWMRRRYKVIQQMLGENIQKSSNLGEIGCGSGVLQRQIEDDYGKGVDGFDLNYDALKKSYSRFSQLYVYDVFESRAIFQSKYELLFLCDVLEHVDDHLEFMTCALSMIKNDGLIVLNLPAYQFFYSRYDEVAGHRRRYNLPDIDKLVRSVGANIYKWTYWGMPLLPLLLVRKIVLKNVQKAHVIRKGIGVNSRFLNSLYYYLSCMEICPQHIAGTSLCVAIRKINI